MFATITTAASNSTAAAATAAAAASVGKTHQKRAAFLLRHHHQQQQHQHHRIASGTNGAERGGKVTARGCAEEGNADAVSSSDVVESCRLEIGRMMMMTKVTSSSSSSSSSSYSSRCTVALAAAAAAEEMNDESIPRRGRGELQIVHAMGRGGRGRGGRGRGGGRRSGGGRGRNRGPWRNPNQGPLRNEQLLDFEELRVLGPEKEMLGVMSTEEALEKGEELGLDLVIVSPEADPPVAKFMDYSKYKYEKEKKDREKKRQAKLTQVELKEVKMRYNIDTHDYDVRLRSSQKFLSNGDKVKVICQFRGRENDFRHIGREMFDRFVEDIEEYGTLEKQPGMEGNAMTMYIVPRVSKDEVNKRYEQEKKMKNKRERQSAEEEEEEDEEEEEYEEEYEEEEVEA
jgi:translation initiation factor IF-3